jgi:hypothetical protein
LSIGELADVLKQDYLRLELFIWLYRISHPPALGSGVKAMVSAVIAVHFEGWHFCRQA